MDVSGVSEVVQLIPRLAVAAEKQQHTQDKCHDSLLLLLILSARDAE